MKNKWRNKIFATLSFPQINISFPSQQIWSKSIILLQSPHFTSESSPIPTLDYSSACRYVRYLFVVSLRTSAWGPHDCLPTTSSVQPHFFFSLSQSRMPRPGCYLWSRWEKSPRTNSALNFQQSRENTSTVIQFNVVLFGFSPSHISLKSLSNNVTLAHTLAHTHGDWFIDYIMSPAVMFHSHVHSVIV